MTSALALIDQTPNIIIIAPTRPEQLWLRYFNIAKAAEAVAAHVAALPSSRTPERHTWHVYKSGLDHFLKWSDQQLPTEDLLNNYIANLVQIGLKSSTIGSKYLAPVRLFLKKLASQNIDTTEINAYMFVGSCREHIRQAAAVSTPKSETVSNIAPLWRNGKRLTTQQVNGVLRGIDTSSIIGKRDYALLLIAFYTGLRLAELHRITLASITPQEDIYHLTVRGKRSNIDPVPLPPVCYHALCDYVTAYNAPLDVDDPRRITQTSPVWQPLIRGGHHTPLGLNGYNPARGVSHQAIRDVIARRAGIAAHDTRRTFAAIGYEAGMPLTDIQANMRHKTAAITLSYIGTKPELHKRNPASYFQLG